MNILSFDIEDWFHILDHEEVSDKSSWKKFPSRLEDGLEKILQLLNEKEVSATFFCLGWVASDYPELIKKIIQHGHEIGSHSNLHTLVYTQTPSEFKIDLKKSIDLLEDVSGQKIKIYRAPGFSIGKSEKWAFEIMTELGIEIDCSVFPAKRAHGGFKNFPASGPSILNLNTNILKIMPMNIKKFFNFEYVFSGGGYFRLFPYKFIKNMMKNSDYVMTYFHPRDFDPDQPMMPNLSNLRKFKSYYGLKSSEKKLNNLLDDFVFINVSQADKMINWSNAPKLEIDAIN